jgi:hypothetical protein
MNCGPRFRTHCPSNRSLEFTLYFFSYHWPDILFPLYFHSLFHSLLDMSKSSRSFQCFSVGICYGLVITAFSYYTKQSHCHLQSQ